MQPLVLQFAIPVISMLPKKLTIFCSIFVVGLFSGPIFALEVTEPTAAAHAYPGLCDIHGRKLADGEFRQWVEDQRLNVVITYKFPEGVSFEEKAPFRQQPKLIQEQWSWKDLKNERVQREFPGDFWWGTATAHFSKETKMWFTKFDM